MTRVSMVIAVVLSMVSCIHVSQSQGMADIDITEPPPQMERPERIVPEVAPIEAMKAVLMRPFWEFGRADQGDGHGRGRHHNVGAEIILGAAKGSGEDANPSFLGAESMAGISAGCGPCLTRSFGSGRYYAEAHSWSIFFDALADPVVFLPFTRTSVGWSYEPDTRAHGPQITSTLGEILHIRWYRHFGESSSFLFGLSVPVGAVLVRTR